MDYDLKSAKEIVIMEALYADYELGRLSGKHNADIEEEIITDALFTVLDAGEDAGGSREQFKMLMSAYYALRGIKDNLITMNQDVRYEDNYEEVNHEQKNQT